MFCLPQGMAAQKAKLKKNQRSLIAATGTRVGSGGLHASQTPGHQGVTESQGVRFRLGMVFSLRPGEGAAPAYSKATVLSLAVAVAVSTEKPSADLLYAPCGDSMKKTDRGSKLFT